MKKYAEKFGLQHRRIEEKMENCKNWIIL